MAYVIGVAAIAVLVGLYLAVDQRYRGRGNRNARPTSEVFRDPGSGELTRVYEDPATGQREYKRDDPL